MKLNSSQHFHTWGKGKLEGHELPRTQWIIYNPETKTLTHNTINKIHE